MRAKQHANPNSPPPGKLRRVIQSRLSYFSHSMWRATPALLFAGTIFWPVGKHSCVQQHFYHAPLFIYPLAEEKMGSNGRSRVHNTRKQNFGLIRPSIAFLLMQKFRVHCEYTHAVVKKSRNSAWPHSPAASSTGNFLAERRSFYMDKFFCRINFPVRIFTFTIGKN